MVLPSSHCSEPSTTPSPHLVLWQVDWGGVALVTHAYPGSMAHVALQPSPDAVLPSSHCSSPAMMPSPHFLATHLVSGVGHCQPGSSWHVDEQPSPDTAL